MKLTNHSDSNIYDINTYIMRGTISMTQEELLEVYPFLLRELKKAIKNVDTATRDGLWNIKDRFNHRRGKRKFCLGITATRLIVKKYNLKNYKDVNYGIKIKK